MSIPEQVPSELIAGDTWRWTLSFADYSAPTWDVSIYFENSAATFNVAGTDDGSNHSFSIAAATTATYKPGRYQWRARVTDGTIAETVASGWLQVLLDPAAAGTHDVRSWARRTLEAVEAFLEGNASTAQAAMSIQGRSISRWSLVELRQWRDDLKQEVRTEERQGSGGNGRHINVRFSRG